MSPPSSSDNLAGLANVQSLQVLADAVGIQKPALLQLELSIPDLKLSDYECEAFHAEEGVSRPFRVEAVFIKGKDLTGTSVVGKSAWLCVKEHGQKHEFAGVVLEFRLLNKIDLNNYTYAVVIGPRLALLDRTRQSAVFSPDGALGLKDLLEGILSGSLYSGATVVDLDRGVTLDYDVQDLGLLDYKRPNVTKYNESDFQFFSRICEHYGVFYFFESFKSGETIKDKVVVAATNSAFVAAATSPWKYQPATTTIGVMQAAVTSLEWVARPPLRTFKLRDFSEDKPDTDMLISSTETKSDGVGTVVEYGDHFLSRDEGEELVEIRAQEEAWQASVYQFESTRCELRAGQVFTLTGHGIAALNTEYIVLEARHEGGKRGPLGYVADYPSMHYRNRFTAIKKSQAFRPRRVTPRPVMAGVFNAVVEAESTSTTRAALDSSGRYRIGFGYNEMASRKEAGKGTAPIRQAQPYAGSSADSVVGGMHFPLVRNTEVLVGYVNGDPDRPVILGAAFNQNNVNPVNSGSQTANRIRSTGGLLMEMEDGTDSSASRYIRLDVPKGVTDAVPADDTSTAASGTYLRLGGLAPDKSARSGLKYSTSTVSQDSQDNKNEDKSFSEKASSSKTSKTKSKVTPTEQTPSGKGVLVYSDDDIDINVKGAGLMKYGSGHTTKTVNGDSAHTVDNGQYTLKVANGITIEAKGNNGPADILIHATNTVTTKSDGDTYDWIYGNTTKYTQGNAYSVFYGTEESMKMAVSISMQLGLKIDVIYGNATKIVNSDLKLAGTDYKICLVDDKTVLKKDNIGLAVQKIFTQNYESSILKVLVGGVTSAKKALDDHQAAVAVKKAALKAQQEALAQENVGIKNIS
ncbi:type VI secretion system Vgr family protein [Xanthobacter sediminis]